MVAKNRWGNRKVRRGEAVNTAKLTADDVIAIRRIYGMGGITAAAIARTYNVTIQQIGHIVKRRCWKHVS